MEPTLADHVLAALFGLVLPLSALVRHDPEGPGEMTRGERAATLLANSAFLWITAGLVCAAWWWADRPWADLGLVRPSGGHGWTAGVVALFVLGYGLDVWRKVRTPERRAKTRERWRRDTPFMPRAPRELPVALVVCASAGICEEIVFRGFLVSYVASYTGGGLVGGAVAVLLPAVVFAVGHRYQGWAAVAMIVGMAAGFGAIFLVSGSLLVPMVLHFAVDLFGTLLGMRLLRDA